MIQKKRIVVSFIYKAKEFYVNLVQIVSQEKEMSAKNTFNNQLLKSIMHQIDKIKIRFPQGISIPKHLIPRELKIKYKLTNLFYCKLTQGYRMLYSLVRGKDNMEVLCIISIIANHKEYEEIMGYN